ncbi:mannosyl-3-phosphoglycerate phosphatase [Chromohalobacter marismortui]|uniref:Mannosyl-3-phosphoglycerate phosphatase n=1 Tax=Chromohalobacter marismortui TaxID=42055 RepID=A0A4R7NJ51_9GAMM|nr:MULTISPECIES: HAD-IIB family hydrolase [Chromohalobacter]MCI0511571.1 HAD-IIB family hydrolase [Chromohalobacter sp.]MCI0594496.1 HAD-IIB family hydrolase [Chromohalobacter sp.]TDU20512.1 mannosyl-3-phosphoglycerate phosphatase [Chromohalobacter marismortui]
MTQSVSQTPWLVFTDLDGTLLDHDSYTWQPAAAWLSRLAEADVTVIPTTSKTREELLSLRDELGLTATPFIAENGAVIGLPARWQHARLDRDPSAPDGLIVKTPSLDIGFIRRRLAVLRERLDVRFRGMGDLSLDTVCELTALSADKARQALAREGSEPLLWDDDESALERFRHALESDGLRLTRGGRFWHVMGAVDKGQSVRWLIDRYAALRGTRPASVGLGDGPNDVSLLEAVDHPILVRGKHAAVIDVAPKVALYRTRQTGPEGWAEGIADWWQTCMETSSMDNTNKARTSR